MTQSAAVFEEMLALTPSLSPRRGRNDVRRGPGLDVERQLQHVSREMQFIAAVNAAWEQIRRDEIVSLDEMEKKIQSWATR